MIDAWKAWLEQGLAMKATLRYFSEVFDDFDEFLDALEGVSRIYFVGHGDSLFVGQAADFFARYLGGIPTEAHPAFEFARHCPPLDATTLVVAISASGKVKATLEAARRAKQGGAPVVALTCNAGSPLALESSFVLTPVLNQRSVVPLNSTTSSMVLLFVALLFVVRSFREDFPPDVDKKFDFVEDELNRLPGVIDRLVQSVEPAMRVLADEVAQSVVERGSAELHYVGSGPGRVCATIGATKVKELCYLHAEAKELEEFAHYQKLLVDEGAPVFFVCPARAERRVDDFLRAFDRLGARVYLFASPALYRDLESQAKRFPKSVKLFTMPSVLEVFQPVAFAVPLQVFALYLTLALGGNPTTFRSPAHLEFVDLYVPDPRDAPGARDDQ